MYSRSLRSKWIAAGVALLTIALTGCEQWSVGSVGNDGSISSASVDPDNLCDWSHYTNYDDPRALMAVSCKSSRQIYTTCDIWLWPRVGGPERERTHGTQSCNARVYPYGTPNWGLGAIGSIGTIWMRLDNPSRRWRRGFRTGDPISCSIYENANSQSILECGDVHGSPNIPARAGRLGRAMTADELQGIASKLSPAARARVTGACGQLSANALRNLNPNGRCAQAGRQALAELPAGQRRKALGQLKSNGVSLRDQGGRGGSAE